jgi:hypothetical protein
VKTEPLPQRHAVDDVLTEDEVAERYEVAARTVKRWRASRIGPRWFYAGRYVRYRMAAILAWEEAEEMRAAS